VVDIVVLVAIVAQETACLACWLQLYQLDCWWSVSLWFGRLRKLCRPLLLSFSFAIVFDALFETDYSSFLLLLDPRDPVHPILIYQSCLLLLKLIDFALTVSQLTLLLLGLRWYLLQLLNQDKLLLRKDFEFHLYRFRLVKHVVQLDQLPVLGFNLDHKRLTHLLELLFNHLFLCELAILELQLIIRLMDACL